MNGRAGLGYSRREFFRDSALAVGAAGVLPLSGPTPAKAADNPKGLPLSMAGYRFDRTNALIDGRVVVEGCEMQFRESSIGDLNTHVFSGPQTLDVTEIGLHPFMLAFANDGS
jgi:4,5-dihydroxyphthalate decarboxylase